MRNHIGTITLNPAIDESITISGFEADKVNRVETMERHPGGKGVNVARFLSDFVPRVTASGFLGRENERIFTDYFRRYGIADEFIRIDGETRTGLKVLDPVGKTVTEINYPGITPGEEDRKLILETVGAMAEKCGIIVVSGSIPGSLSPDIYRQIVERINRAGIKALVDTSGAAFREALKAVPYMIKPNIHELEEFFGEELKSEEAVLEKCAGFFEQGISLVVVSMGEKGALFATPEECFKAIPPATAIVSTVGAGDAMVSGTAYSLSEGLSLEETARLATAFSLHAVTHMEMGITDREFFEKAKSSVTVERIERLPASLKR